MSTQAVTKKDIAASVVPPIQVGGAPWDVMAVEALDGYRLWVRFADGLEGEVDMSAGLSTRPMLEFLLCWPIRRYFPRYM